MHFFRGQRHFRGHTPPGERIICVCNDLLNTFRLSKASGAPIAAINMVRDMNRTGTLDVGDLDKSLAHEVRQHYL